MPHQAAFPFQLVPRRQPPHSIHLVAHLGRRCRHCAPPPRIHGRHPLRHGLKVGVERTSRRGQLPFALNRHCPCSEPLSQHVGSGQCIGKSHFVSLHRGRDLRLHQSR